MKKIRILITMLFVVVFAIMGLNQVKAQNPSNVGNHISLPSNLTNDTNYYIGNIGVNNVTGNYTLEFQRIWIENGINALNVTFNENDWKNSINGENLLKETKQIKIHKDSYTGSGKFKYFLRIKGSDSNSNINETVNIVYDVDGGRKLKLSLDNTKTMQVGESISLDNLINIEPEGTNIENVVWTSDDENENVVKIENGKVVAKGIGEATITVTANVENNTDNKDEASCTITVNENNSNNSNNTSIKITNSNKEIEVGKTLQLRTETEPSDAEIVWESDNEKIATVNQNGIVTGVKAGDVTITAKLKNDENVKDQIQLKVVNKNEQQNTNTDDGKKGDNTVTQFTTLPQTGSLTYLLIVAVVGVGVAAYFIYKKVKYYDV